MSIITTKSSIMSILKMPNNARRSSLNRVRFQLPRNIVKIFENYKSNLSSREYQDLVTTIRDAEISDTDLLSLLTEAKKCIPILSYDLRLFVQALNIIKWAHRSEEVVKSYQEFINDLVSAHSEHTKVILDQLVKSFFNIEESGWSRHEPLEVEKNQFDNIHNVIKSILERVPLSEDILVQCMSDNFPHFLKKINLVQLLCYVYNSLRVISYEPHLRVNILQIILEQLVLRDVNSPKEDIIHAEEQQNDMLYEMEVDEDSPLQRLKHPVADACDGIMEILLIFIKNECYEGEKLMQVKCHKLYNELLNLFEEVILPIHSHHIQFILFYICSFENTLTQQFLKYMWGKAISPTTAPVIRQTCISYLSGFLARGDYVLLGYLKNYLIKMNEWINNYISCNSENSEENHCEHSVFYFMCQAVFYLIAFRHEDLVDSRSRLTFLQSLNLSKIINCKLNPLRMCPPELLEHFADVACDYQLAYCYTIIENNSRNSLTIVDRDGNVKNKNIIEMYFPFDPLVLPRSSNYIKPLYREYHSVKNKEAGCRDSKTKQNSQNSSSFREGFSPNSGCGMSYEN